MDFPPDGNLKVNAGFCRETLPGKDPGALLVPALRIRLIADAFVVVGVSECAEEDGSPEASALADTTGAIFVVSAAEGAFSTASSKSSSPRTVDASAKNEKKADVKLRRIVEKRLPFMVNFLGPDADQAQRRDLELPSLLGESWRPVLVAEPVVLEIDKTF